MIASETVSRYRRIALSTIVGAFVGSYLAAARSQDDECEETWRAPTSVLVDERVTEVRLTVDPADRANIATVAGEELSVRIVSSGADILLPVETNGIPGDPSLDTTSSGVTYVTYTLLDSEEPALGRDIYLARNSGGVFTTPRRLSASRLDDYAPQQVLDRRGNPHVVWAQRVGGSSRVLYWNDEIGDPSIVADEGDYPAVFMGDDDIVHVVFSSKNDLFYARGIEGAFADPVRVTNSPFVPESSATLGRVAERTILIAYESNNSLYVSASTSETEFAPQQLLEAGGVQQPRMRVRRSGKVLIAFAKFGDIYTIVGQDTALTSATRVFESADIESLPTLDADQFGNLHLSYLANGESQYTNNVCAPAVDFVAEPTSGRVPLAVQFTDLSTGDATHWEWDFGDGGSSGVRNPVHTYQDPGSYDVTLTVAGPGGAESSKTIEDLVVVQNPLYSYRIPNQQVLPGAEGVWFPVIASYVEEIRGFQVMGTYDPNFLSITGSDYRYTAIDDARIEPEFEQTNVFDRYFEVGVLFQTQPPFDDVVLPPSRGTRLVNLIVDVLSSAPQGETTVLRLENDANLSRIKNIVVVGVDSIPPALKSANVHVRSVEPPFPRRFRRGDVDHSGSINVTDAIFVLNYLFGDQEAPSCLDAADFTDAGGVDISSGIAILNFLFGEGAPPAVPFPNEGLDPTDDPLGECLAI